MSQVSPSSTDQSYRQWIAAYIIAEICLFFLIKTAEIRQFSYSITGKLMYSAIVLNFITICCVVFWGGKIAKKNSCRELPTKPPAVNRYNQLPFSFIPIALTVTLAADFFLVLIDRFWLTGVILFCVVETTYAIQLERDAFNIFSVKKTAHIATSVFTRILLFMIFIYVLYHVSYLNTLSAFAVLNMAMLTGNAVFAWIAYGKKRDLSSLLFALGLLLFTGCDLSLGLRNFCFDMTGMDGMYRICAFLVWVFYLPSQVLIVLSVPALRRS